MRAEKISSNITLLLAVLCYHTTSGAVRPSRLTFGSCNNQDLRQPLWPVIESRNAAAFIFGGDAIYADSTQGLNFSEFPSIKPVVRQAVPETFRKAYRKQLDNPGYQNLLRTNITVFGCLDDHDYGVNNGDRTYPYAREGALSFLKFISEPAQSPMYRRADRGFGLYGVKIFDFSRPIGQELLTDEEAAIDIDTVNNTADHTTKTKTAPLSSKSVAVFVLDVRTNKTPWKKGVQYDHEGDFLGDRQWQWFEASLKRSTATVNVIVQGLPVHAHRHRDANAVEDWEKFPNARQRLYDALLQDSVQAPILISGDVHMAQLMRSDCYFSHTKYTQSLIEITTSGMTHSWGNCFSSQAKFHRQSWYRRYVYFVSRSAMTLMHAVMQLNDVMISNGSTGSKMMSGTGGLLSLYGNGGGEGSKQGTQYSLELNFGELEFDWENGVVISRILGLQDDGGNGNQPPLMSASWTLGQLNGGEAMPQVLSGEQVEKEMAMTGAVASLSGWQCMAHRGFTNPLRFKIGEIALISWFFITVIFPTAVLPFAGLLALLYYVLRRIRVSACVGKCAKAKTN